MIKTVINKYICYASLGINVESLFEIVKSIYLANVRNQAEDLRPDRRVSRFDALFKSVCLIHK